MALADTVLYPIGLIGLSASIDTSKTPLMFLRDDDGQCVLLLRHEMVALRDLLNTIDLDS